MRGWGIPRGRRLRVFFIVLALLVPPPILAYIVGEFDFSFWVAMGLAIGMSAMYLLFSAIPGQGTVLKATDISNFYSRGQLALGGVFLGLLIAFIIYRLWKRFPG